MCLWFVLLIPFSQLVLVQLQQKCTKVFSFQFIYCMSTLFIQHLGQKIFGIFVPEKVVCIVCNKILHTIFPSICIVIFFYSLSPFCLCGFLYLTLPNFRLWISCYTPYCTYYKVNVSLLLLISVRDRDLPTINKILDEWMCYLNVRCN